MSARKFEGRGASLMWPMVVSQRATPRNPAAASGPCDSWKIARAAGRGYPTSRIASSSRRSVSSFPRICTTSYMPGDAVPPVSATRTGCAILPSPSPRFSASPWKSFSSALGLERRRAPRCRRGCASRIGLVSGVRNLSFAFGSSCDGRVEVAELLHVLAERLRALARDGADVAELRVVRGGEPGGAGSRAARAARAPRPAASSATRGSPRPSSPG